MAEVTTHGSNSERCTIEEVAVIICPEPGKTLDECLEEANASGYRVLEKGVFKMDGAEPVWTPTTENPTHARLLLVKKDEPLTNAEVRALEQLTDEELEHVPASRLRRLLATITAWREYARQLTGLLKQEREAHAKELVAVEVEWSRRLAAAQAEKKT